MTDFREIMNQAELARRKMVVSKAEGLNLFDALIQERGEDGMIYFKRAEAFEALGNFKKSLADFRIAKALFPMPKWKQIAQDGIDRTEKEISKE